MGLLKQQTLSLSKQQTLSLSSGARSARSRCEQGWCPLRGVKETLLQASHWPLAAAGVVWLLAGSLSESSHHFPSIFVSASTFPCLIKSLVTWN